MEFYKERDVTLASGLFCCLDLLHRAVPFYFCQHLIRRVLESVDLAKQQNLGIVWHTLDPFRYTLPLRVVARGMFFCAI